MSGAVGVVMTPGARWWPAQGYGALLTASLGDSNRAKIFASVWVGIVPSLPRGGMSNVYQL